MEVGVEVGAGSSFRRRATSPTKVPAYLPVDRVEIHAMTTIASTTEATSTTILTAGSLANDGASLAMMTSSRPRTAD